MDETLHKVMCGKKSYYRAGSILKNIERLPIHVMTSPVMHYDLSALIILLSAIFKSES